MNWQTIDTLPDPDGANIIVGVWVDGRWSCWTIINNGEDFGNDGKYGDEPTHWALVIPPSIYSNK